MGIPGSGKSTVRSLLLESLNRQKIPCLSMEQALLSSLKANVDGILFKCLLRMLPANMALKYAPLVFTRSALRYAAQNAFLSTHGKSVSTVLSSDYFLQAAPSERETVLSRFLLTASQYQLIREHAAEYSPVLFDEGFLQKSASLFVSPGEKTLPDTAFLSSYLDIIPRPDIVLYLQTDVKTCMERIIARPKGMPERLVGRNRQEIQSYLEANDSFIQSIAELANTKDYYVGVIENNGSPEEVVSRLQRVIQGYHFPTERA